MDKQDKTIMPPATLHWAVLLSRTDFSRTRTRTRTWGSEDEDEEKDLRSEDEDKDSNFKC